MHPDSTAERKLLLSTRFKLDFYSTAK